jgi:hypothetical protein
MRTSGYPWLRCTARELSAGGRSSWRGWHRFDPIVSRRLGDCLGAAALARQPCYFRYSVTTRRALSAVRSGRITTDEKMKRKIKSTILSGAFVDYFRVDSSMRDVRPATTVGQLNTQYTDSQRKKHHKPPKPIKVGISTYSTSPCLGYDVGSLS